MLVTIFDFWRQSILKCHQNYIISDNSHYKPELFDRIHVVTRLGLQACSLVKNPQSSRPGLRVFNLCELGNGGIWLRM